MRSDSKASMDEFEGLRQELQPWMTSLAEGVARIDLEHCRCCETCGSMTLIVSSAQNQQSASVDFSHGDDFFAVNIVTPRHFYCLGFGAYESDGPTSFTTHRWGDKIGVADLLTAVATGYVWETEILLDNRAIASTVELFAGGKTVIEDSKSFGSDWQTTIRRADVRRERRRLPGYL